MAYTNVHRGVRCSPKKVLPLIPLIRGMRIDEAVTLLTFSKRRAAIFIKQALLAAKANADQAEVDVRRLVVTEARVDDGPRMKRFQPKDRGRSHQIIKRTGHITVAVDVK
jgi:large subunit ribosomal protein L22